MGVPTSKRGPHVSHLLFADDSLLFCRASTIQWNNLVDMLNQNMTTIFLSKNTLVPEKTQILEIVGLPTTQRYDSYLGLPTLVGKSRTTTFPNITERVWKQLQNWKIKLLSQAGKEILLKTVIQAIPTYCMSVFLLPKTLCLEINSLMQRFWWGHMEKDKRIAWMSWSRMGLPKG